MNILGISGIFNHDAAACIVQDGNVLAMVEEERIIRKKRAYKALPIESAKYCLNQAGINPEDVDVLAVGWDPTLFKSQLYDSQYVNKFINDMCWSGRLNPKVIFVPHHLAHAASAYFVSNIETGVVLVIDGHGENASTSVGVCKNGKIQLEQEFPISYSLGHFYESVAKYLGLGSNSAGKMMGLAAYSSEKNLFHNLISSDSFGYRINIMEKKESDFKTTQIRWMQYLTERFGSNHGFDYIWDRVGLNSKSEIREFERAASIAASAQDILEQTVINLVQTAFAKYHTNNLLLSGGVALNCSMNGKIIRKLNPSQFFVCPASNDAGVALGAALFVHGGKSANIFSPYLGPEINEKGIKTLLEKWNIKHRLSSDIISETADTLAEGKTVGFVQGREEIGPRALGNRSILALPISTNIRDRVNEIKSREKWRPLSPSLISDNSKKIFGKRIESKYMLEAHYVQDSVKQNIIGTVHVDNTCRPQVLDRIDNPIYFDLINQVYKKTGVLAVLNTSFNDAFEPMILSAKDAIRTYMTSSLDVLVIGNIIVEKK